MHVLQQLVTRHREQKERVTQLLEQVRKEGSTTTSPTRVNTNTNLLFH